MPVRDLDREDTLRGLRSELAATKMMADSPQFAAFIAKVEKRRSEVEGRVIRGDGSDGELRELIGAARAYRSVVSFVSRDISVIEKSIKQVEGFGNAQADY